MSDNPKNPKSRHNPFRGFLDVMSETNRARSQWLTRTGEGGSGESDGGRSQAAAYVPPADIFATGNDLIVRCEVPGVRHADVSVTVSSGMLTISGYRDSELSNDNDVVYYTRERVYGAFRRSMLLPEGVEQDAIHAVVRNGLLEIRVSGGAAAKPQTINIVDESDG